MSTAETLHVQSGDVQSGDGQSSASPVHLARRVRQMASELAAERAEVDKVVNDLAEAHRIQAVLERDKAVAEAQARQLERQLEHGRMERSLLSTRMATLMLERDQAIQAMGWWSRRRYARLRRSRAIHPSQPEGARKNQATG